MYIYFCSVHTSVRLTSVFPIVEFIWMPRQERAKFLNGPMLGWCHQALSTKFSLVQDIYTETQLERWHSGDCNCFNLFISWTCCAIKSTAFFLYKKIICRPVLLLFLLCHFFFLLHRDCGVHFYFTLIMFLYICV